MSDAPEAARRSLPSTLEALCGLLWDAAKDLGKHKRKSQPLIACCDTLRHLPPHRAVSPLAAPEAPARELQWAADVAEYGLFLARLSACELAYCDDKVGVAATLPYEPPEEGRGWRIVVPVSEAFLESAGSAGAELPPRTAPSTSTALLPTLEFRAHDGSGDWSPKPIARFGLRSLATAWIIAATGRDGRRMAKWIRNLFSAFWKWHRTVDAGESDDASDEQSAAGILAQAHEITAEAERCMQQPALRPAHYPVHLRAGAKRFLSFRASSITRRMTGPLEALTKELGKAQGLAVVPASEASPEDVDHRIAFRNELPAPPDAPAIVRKKREPDAPPVRRGAQFTAFDAPPEHLVMVMELETSGQLRPFKAGTPWFRAVRRSIECGLLESRDLASTAECRRVARELAVAHSNLVTELWKAEEQQLVRQVAAYTEHHFGLILVPPLPADEGAALRLRRGDEASCNAVDWDATEAEPSDNETRGMVLGVKRFGVRTSAEPLRLARLTLSLGQASRIESLANGLGRAVERLDWISLDAEAVVAGADRVADAALVCDADFFQDRVRERDLLKGWLETLEADIGEDAERAIQASRMHISLLQRYREVGAVLSPFLTVTHIGNVTLEPSIVKISYAYYEDTAPMDVLGILSTGLFGEDRKPQIMLSRGPRQPEWIEPFLEAARAVPDAVADLEAEFQRALESDPMFDTPTWRAQFAARLLRAAGGSSAEEEQDGTALQALQIALRSAPDMERFGLVPEVSASGEVAPVDLEAGGAALQESVTQWFTKDVPAGTVVAVERPGLVETLADKTSHWHVMPHITVSAGVHTEFTQRLQPLLRRIVKWLDLAPLTPKKLARHTKVMRSSLLPLFREMAVEEDQEAAAARLLCGPKGIVAFLAKIGCRNEKLLARVEVAAASCGLEIEARSGAGFAEEDAEDLESAPVLVSSWAAEEKAGRIVRGLVEQSPRSVAGAALALIHCLGRRDDVDEDGRMARAVGDTLLSLVDEDSNLKSSAVFLASKIYALPEAAPAPAEADAPGDGTPTCGRRELDAVVEACFAPLGLSVFPIELGEDVRKYEGRYRARPGAVNWRVLGVDRPCIMSGDQVLQFGIVETD